MHGDPEEVEIERDRDADRKQSWRRPIINKISIKQITRGGMMVGSDMMGMGMMMTS